MQTSVAIVGAGYAGLAAAVELVDRGNAVTVYEAAREIGGRARVVERHGTRLDNGQHILIGAYTSTLALMRRIGASEDRLLRLPLQWRFPPRFKLEAARLPAPLHLAFGLLGARGMPLRARLGCLGFMLWCQRAHFRLATDRTVSSLLQEHRQHEDAVRFLWEPLCLAALNTPPEEASAQIFLNVLRDGLAAGRSASDLLLPAVDMSALLPRPAAAYVAARGGEIRTGSAVRGIERDERGFSVTTGPTCTRHSAVIVATAPHAVPGLIGHFDGATPNLACIEQFRYESIATVYLGYEHPVRLPAPMLGLSGELGQWLFDRGRICGQQGLLSVVISARGRRARIDRDDLAARVHSEIAPLILDAGTPLWSQVFEERRATFSCTPDLQRPATTTGVAGLYLCGDYTASDYPGTLEAAVRSGLQCARTASERLASGAGGL